jgi:hypothetical protein
VVAAGAVLLLAAPAFAVPTLTKSKIRLTKKGEVRLSARGTLHESDWGSPEEILIRVGSHEATLPIASFKTTRNGRKLRYRGEKAAVVRKAVVDLDRGKLLLKCRSTTAEDYADPLPLALDLAVHWMFDLPVDPERKVSKFKGELPGATETAADAIFAGGGTGERVPLVLTVWDDSSRPVDLLVEYSTDGGGTWSATTQRQGEDPPMDVPSAPQGHQVGYTWEAYEDLGCGTFPGVIVRAMPVDPKGSGDWSEPFDIVTYGEAEVGELASDIYADLRVDGSLDEIAVVDARSAAEFDLGHIPGAVHVQYDGFPKDRRIVFYCYGTS